jgi:hypothetical protein
VTSCSSTPISKKTPSEYITQVSIPSKYTQVPPTIPILETPQQFNTPESSTYSPYVTTSSMNILLQGLKNSDLTKISNSAEVALQLHSISELLEQQAAATLVKTPIRNSDLYDLSNFK